ncbi:MAG TPA: DUF6682 family protein [Woeseiaceae bacterium]|nr:DUF6682 family protein [Woeseiaceae bacterium]
MPRSVNNFLEDVSADLTDPGFDVWSKSSLLGFVKDGLGLLIQHVPSQFTATTDITLVDGPTQTLPTNVIEFVRPVCNLTSGTTPGRTIRPVSMRALERSSPTWRTATPAAVTRQIAYDPGTPDEFYVIPPGVAGEVIRIEAIVEPEDLDIDDNLPIDSRYTAALHSYVLFRAYSRDDDYANAGKATQYWAAFAQQIGMDDGANQ